MQAAELSWKAAQNIWGTATKICDDATESKHEDIKCRSDNPAAGVRGPDRGAHTEKQFLYPSEFLAFVRHPEVPIVWRRIAAVAVYTYAHDAELRVLECSDVDLEHEAIRVMKALNRRNGAVKATKGKGARTVPIEPAVAALLDTMKARAAHREAGGEHAERAGHGARAASLPLEGGRPPA